jgi:peptide/nickel transport system permease protein
MNGFWWRFLKRPSAAFGTAGVLLVIAVALLAPWIAPVGPWEIVGTPFQPPLSKGHLLGTDLLGRDILAGILHGARVSLIVGLVSAAAAALIGILLGSIAGYYGGVADDILMRLTEFFQVIPGFVFAVVLVAVFRPSIGSIVVAIAIVSWPPVARLVRSEFLSLRAREFVEAATVLGVRDRNIIFGEILPNALSPVLAMATLMVASAILLESALGFLGLGDPNKMSWGYMIGVSRTVIRLAWWMSVFPGLAIVLTVLSINLVGEGIGLIWNPRLQRRGEE